MRPELLQDLLAACQRVAVKRIFLFLAEISGHDLFNQIDVDLVDLEKGKRQIRKGAFLDKTYKITVPQSYKLTADNNELF